MSVNTANFHELHPEGKTLIFQWFKKGSAEPTYMDEQSFEPFIYTYIAFNGWAACVTGEDLDRKMINALKSDQELASAFGHWLEHDSALRRDAEAFQKLWPIFSAKEIRRRGLLSSRSSNRVETISCLKQRNVSSQPQIAESYELNLPNTLDALYQVRCNLFHGEKCVSSEADQQIVGAAYRVLSKLMERYLGDCAD